jgi:hypothetical protein
MTYYLKVMKEKKILTVKCNRYTIKKVFLLLLFFFQISLVKAQKGDSDTITAKKKEPVAVKSYFRFKTSYTTNDVYNGRKDSILNPYVKPSVGYYNKSGFSTYMSAYFSMQPNQKSFDYLSLHTDYTHEITDDFSAGVFAYKAFHDPTSTLIKSNIKGNIGANLDYDWGFIDILVQGDVIFTTKNDYNSNIELYKQFVIKKKNGKIVITPTFDVNFSTLNYYEGYLNKQVGRKQLNKKPNVTSVSSNITVNNNHFTLMDYELSLPMSYKTKHFSFFITPTFAIPQNSIHTTTTTTVSLSNGVQTSAHKDSTPQSELNLTNTLYAEIGLYYKFI